MSDDELQDSMSNTSDDDDQVIRDLYRNNRANKIQRLHSLERDSSDDELESNESSDDGIGNNMTYNEENDFVVDDDNKRITVTHHQINASSNTRLNEKDLSNAWKLLSSLDNESPSIQTIVERKVSLPKTVERETINDPLPDEFERDCNKCTIKAGIIKQGYVSEWLLINLFMNRMPNMSEKDIYESEDCQKEIRILNELLQVMFNQGNLVSTPQYIKNCRPDLLYGESDEPQSTDEIQSIFTEDDVYKILEGCKKYENVLKKRDLIVVPIAEFIKKYEKEGYYKDLYEFLTDTDDIRVYKDSRRFLQLHVDDQDKGNILFLKREKLFEELVKEFLLNPSELAIKLKSDSSNSDISEPPEPIHSPDIIFTNFFEENKDYKEACLLQAGGSDDSEVEKNSLLILQKHLVQYAAKDLATNPFLLNNIREQIKPHIIISTEPTQVGEDSPLLLPYEKYGIVKRIKNKMKVDPDFKGSDRWLLISEAEKRGLIKVSFDIVNGIDYEYDIIKKSYLASYSSSWDIIREEILKKAFYEEIWPQIISESREELLQDSSIFISNSVEERLFAYLTAPPYTKRKDSNSPLQTCSVLSLCYHPDFPKEIGMALLRAGGNVEYWNIFNSAILYSKENPTSDEEATIASKSAKEAKEDLKKIFNNSSQLPELIVVSATSLRSLELYKFIYRYLISINKDNQIPIIFAPSDAAIIYARSPVSTIEKHELSQQKEVSEVVLIAASTARRVQNPLHELTRLATQEHNYLVDLPYHPFQSTFIEKGVEHGIIHDACEKACLRAVSITGVDMSLLHSPHHRGPLQFIPGFGPKFAEFLLNSTFAKASTNITNRAQIFEILQHHNNIYKNAISFLRIPAQLSNDDENEEEVQYFDGTLIHPNDYEKANKLIQFIMTNLHDSDNSRSIVKFYQREYQKSINEEMLNKFFEEEKIPMNERKLYKFISEEIKTGPFEALRFIKRDKRSFSSSLNNNKDISYSNYIRMDSKYESLETFRRWRSTLEYNLDNFFIPLDNEELFDLLVPDFNAEKNSCCDFLIRSVSQREYGDIIIAVHPSGIIGISNTRNDQDKECSITPNDIRTIQQATIQNIDKESMIVKISFSHEEIRNSKTKYDRIQSIENKFDIVGEEEAQKEAQRRRENQPNPIQLRVINDDYFRNTSAEQVISELSGQPVGTFLFRPSSKGNDHLTLVIKFPGEMFASYEIVEKGKRANNELMLGKELHIEDEVFEDLDEINWNFVQKINEKVQLGMNHRKWVENYSEALAVITNERNQNPKAAVYRITVNPSDSIYSNSLIFLWLDKLNRQISEPIRIRPNVYRFRHRDFKSLDSIINYWKKNGCQPPVGDELRKHELAKALSEREEREMRERSERTNQYGRH